VSTKRMQINAAVTFYEKNGKFKPTALGPVPEETENELSQFALEFKRFPVPEHYIDKALDDLKLALKESLRKAGYLKW
jgi:hypothetical protein